MKKSKDKINRRGLRKKLSNLNKQRNKYIFSIVHGKPMVLGMPHEVFRKCGKGNCRCARGKLHGPYPALSVNKNGKQKIVMIKKGDAAIILKKSKRYRYFQQTLAKIRKLNKEIDNLLDEIKIVSTGNYS